MFGLDGAKDGAPPRIELGYVAEDRAIAIRKAEPTNLTAANIDKRGYASASRFYHTTKIAQIACRYVFEAEQDGWLVFVAEN